jgi:hypothetical protein
MRLLLSRSVDVNLRSILAGVSRVWGVDFYAAEGIYIDFPLFDSK